MAKTAEARSDYLLSIQAELNDHYKDAQVGSPKFMALYDHVELLDARQEYWSTAGDLNDAIKRSEERKENKIPFGLQGAFGEYLKQITTIANISVLIKSRISTIPEYFTEHRYITEKFNNLSYGCSPDKEEGSDMARRFLKDVIYERLYSKK
ncbi:hypothetical protein HYT59_01825 [Candidatus Woesebacteria bacterium]|nr:hypothetical protein [Candidatus Woesebacteria bacterium]